MMDDYCWSSRAAMTRGPAVVRVRLLLFPAPTFPDTVPTFPGCHSPRLHSLSPSLVRSAAPAETRAQARQVTPGQDHLVVGTLAAAVAKVDEALTKALGVSPYQVRPPSCVERMKPEPLPFMSASCSA